MSEKLDNFIEIAKQNKKLLIIGGVVILLMIIIAVVMIVKNNNDGVETVKPSTSNGGTSSGTSSSSDTITLIYWGLWEPEGVISDIIDKFESDYPNIKIDYSQQSFSNYDEKLYTRLGQTATSTEPSPDIFRIHNTWLPKYVKYLYALPEDIMSANTYASTFYPTAVNDFTYKNGKIYAIPLEVDGLVVFYNTKLLAAGGYDEVPTDWDSFFDMATKLTKRDENGNITQSGLAFGSFDNIKHAQEIIYFLLLQEGMDIIDDTKTTVTLNTAKGKKVFTTYTSFASEDNEDATWSEDLPLDMEMFFEGKLAMLIAPTWAAFDIIEAAPAIEFDTAILPQLEANSDKVYFSTYWGDAVNVNSEHPLEAWAFIEYLSQEENQLALYSNSSKIRAFGEPYSLVGLNSKMVGKKYVDAIAQMAPYMKSWQIGDESAAKDAIGVAINSILTKGYDVETALKNAEKSINEALAVTNQ